MSYAFGFCATFTAVPETLSTRAVVFCLIVTPGCLAVKSLTSSGPIHWG
jgi:hypothetical protein